MNNNYSLTHFLSPYRTVLAKRPKFITALSGTNLPQFSAGLGYHCDYYICPIAKIPFTLPKHLLSSETNQSMALEVKSRSTNPSLCGFAAAQSRGASSSRSSTWCLAAATEQGSNECANADLTGGSRPGQASQNEALLQGRRLASAAPQSHSHSAYFKERNIHFLSKLFICESQSTKDVCFQVRQLRSGCLSVYVLFCKQVSTKVSER